MGFTIGNPQKAKEELLRKAREASASQPQNPASIQKWVSPADCKERLRIIFDDSGSMSSEIKNAVEGTVELFRNCIPNQTAVAVHCLNTHSEKLESLNSNLIEAAVTLQEMRFNMSLTPLFGTMMKAIKLEPKLTRMVLFTDGSPNDELIERKKSNGDSYSNWEPELDFWKRNADIPIAEIKKIPAPIDTVFFGSAHEENEISLLKYIAEQTGGYFLHFDPKKVNFRTAFKYLAPTQRLALASESVRKEIESGKRS